MSVCAGSHTSQRTVNIASDLALSQCTVNIASDLALSQHTVKSAH